MGKHILKCKCGEEHDISEIFGRVVKDWVEKKTKEIKNKKQTCFCGHAKSSHGHSGYSDAPNDIGKGECRTCDRDNYGNKECSRYEQANSKEDGA